MLQTRLPSFGDDEIDRLGANELNVRAGRVKVCVVGDDIAFLAHHAEQNALGGAPLMSRDDVFVPKNILYRRAELLEAAAARITLVAFHHGRPLVRGHRPGAGIGKQVDENVIRRQKKKVIERGAEQLLALRPRRPANGLDALDAKGFDDCARHIGFSI